MLSEGKSSILHKVRPVCVGVTGAQAAGKKKKVGADNGLYVQNKIGSFVRIFKKLI